MVKLSVILFLSAFLLILMAKVIMSIHTADPVNAYKLMKKIPTNTSVAVGVMLFISYLMIAASVIMIIIKIANTV